MGDSLISYLVVHWVSTRLDQSVLDGFNSHYPAQLSQAHLNTQYLEVPDMRTILVCWSELKSAFECNKPGVENFLDTHTGHVEVWSKEDGDSEGELDHFKADEEQYLRIEPVAASEQYKWMESFVATVSNETLKNSLNLAIDGKGAFRRFKDALYKHRSEHDRYLRYRDSWTQWYIQEWLTNHKVEAKEAPPWGVVVKPTMFNSTAPAISEENKPTEVLRRKVRQLVEQVQAMELPGLISYLNFVVGKTTSKEGTQ